MENGFFQFLDRIRIEAENVIISDLSRQTLFGRVGFWVFMPLTVNLVTDSGSVSITISKKGYVGLSRELSHAPDNTVNVDFETLKNLYYSRNKEDFSRAELEERIRIISHTFKGQQAETKLRELLGG